MTKSAIDKAVMVESWAKALKSSGWNIEANVPGWKKPSSVGNLIPDIRARSYIDEFVGLVVSERDLRDIEKLIHGVLCLKLAKERSGVSIHLLAPTGRINYIIKEFRNFPEARVLVDCFWEFFL